MKFKLIYKNIHNKNENSANLQNYRIEKCIEKFTQKNF